MHRHRTRVIAALPLMALLGTVCATGAAAHVVKTFGPYTIAIGWLHEPTFAGQLNAVQLIVKDAQGRAVNDLSGDDLHVQISAAATTSATLTLDPAFDPDTGLGTPGEYDAAVIPTVPGDYTFHLSANVHGTAINQSFTSGPTTFDTVHDATAVEFPSGLPSTSQIVTRVDRDGARVQAALDSAKSSSDAAGRATVLAVAALVVGVGGATVAAVTVVRARRRAAPS